MKSKKCALSLTLMVVFASAASTAQAKQGNFTASAMERHFTVKDDIGMARFQDRPVFSPDNRYFYVLTERGLLEKNVPEDTVSIWSTAEVEKYVYLQLKSPPKPVVQVRVASYKDGPVITNLQWIEDSSGVAYTAETQNGNYRLFRTRVKEKTTDPLTPRDENVTGFAYRPGEYVYTVTSPEVLAEANARPVLPEDVTGKPIEDLLSFQDTKAIWQRYPYSEVWVVRNGIRTHIESISSHQPVHVYEYGGISGNAVATLTLSPDGTELALIQPVDRVPEAWARYASPPGYEQMRPVFKFGIEQQLLASDDLGEAFSKTNSYQLLDLSTGTFSRVVDAPTGHLFEWDAEFFTPRWSGDGHALLLPDTFLPLDNPDTKGMIDNSKHPCIVVVDLRTARADCVLPIAAGFDPHRYAIDDLHFERGNNREIVVSFNPMGYLPTGKPLAVFSQSPDGTWGEVETQSHSVTGSPVEITIAQTINDPPTLKATESSTGSSRILWDPNPQFKGMDWGTAKVITWKDSTGSEYKAGLVLPPHYVPGKRYPLVIQSHGFYESFLTYGAFPSGFCARELAAVGIVVVQMSWNGKDFGKPNEATNQLAGFESLVDNLNREGLIDPGKVGMIGFSRSVYHTYAALVEGEPKLAAASVIDGANGGYWQYMMMVANGMRRGGGEKSQLIGAPPTGDGLQLWLKRSPMFNLDKVTTPLLMLESGNEQILQDWEPYSVLYSLRKPVDMIRIPSGEHVESNPRQRLASQGINVDWFRFWLQGREDPDPAKKAQYERWEHLKDLRNAEDKQSTPN